MKNQQPNIVSIDIKAVKSRMMQVRGQQVLLDRDVAALYGVETRVINQAVKNNPDKFPAGYVAELTQEEVSDLRSKFLTANVSLKSRVLPKVFTEKGLYMIAPVNWPYQPAEKPMTRDAAQVLNRIAQLMASHARPWRGATNKARLDGDTFIVSPIYFLYTFLVVPSFCFMMLMPRFSSCSLHPFRP